VSDDAEERLQAAQVVNAAENGLQKRVGIAEIQGRAAEAAPITVTGDLVGTDPPCDNPGAHPAFLGDVADGAVVVDVLGMKPVRIDVSSRTVVVAGQSVLVHKHGHVPYI
jgi:hypothetical protein